MKRFLSGMVAISMAAILLLPVQVSAVSAQNAIVLDAQTGEVLFEKNPDRQGLIASTTKIMTALLICEQCNVLDRMKIPKEAVDIEGSSMYLKEGEVLTLQELLYGLMLHSGNDAAVALAIYCGGTVEGFVQMMNDKAHRLGLTHTHFENPNGLDSREHYSTARDLAILAAYAMENPIFSKIVSTKSVKIGDRYLNNHNKLLWQVEGADGIKTGYTRAAGRILVSSATRDGRRLIAVTMDAPNDWKDHAVLLNDGFSRFVYRDVLSDGDCLGTVHVIGGQEGQVPLIACDSFSYPLAEGEEIEIVLPKRSFVYAPVVCGQDAGYAFLRLGKKTIGRICLCYGNTVELEQEQPKPSLIKRLLGGICP